MVNVGVKTGFLLVDKPKGITSFLCLKKLRWLSGMKRVGFVGTLDPLASGLMLFALGEATKLISYLEGGDKVYEAVVELGAVSNTYDAEGVIERVDVGKGNGESNGGGGDGGDGSGDSEVGGDRGGRGDSLDRLGRPSLDLIKQVIQECFSGEVMQAPPKFSAIQINGKRAYDLARKGADFELKKRKVVFHKIEVVDYSWPVLRLSVHCGSGTYIRSLAHDLGAELGCGAYLSDLRRTRVGEYRIEDAFSLEEIERKGIDSCLVSCEDFLKDWGRVELTGQEYAVLANGGFIDDIWPRLTKSDRLRKSGSGGLEEGEVFLGIFEGKCVGVLERTGKKIKFKKRFN